MHESCVHTFAEIASPHYSDEMSSSSSSDWSRGVTLGDVGRVAGVSQSTVSLSLSGKWRGRLNASTAERVRKVAEELGYTPNQAAQSLRTGTGSTLLMLVPTLLNPMFAEVHAELATATRHIGVDVAVVPLLGDDPATTVASSGSLAAGFVVCSWPDLEQLGLPRGKPTVLVDMIPDSEFPSVTVDFTLASSRLAAHLAERGYVRAIHISGSSSSWSFRSRQVALSDAVRARGIHYTSGEAIETTAGAFEAVSQWRPRVLDDRTAFICDTDQMALGAYFALTEMGLSIPNDVGLVGTEDSVMAGMFRPSLTSIGVPSGAIAKLTAHQLMRSLEDSSPEQEHDTQSTPAHFASRAST